MGTMIAGLAIWVAAHLFPSLAPAARNRLARRLGVAYQGLFALTVLAGLALIVLGWRSATPVPLYPSSTLLRPLAFALLVAAFILVVAANFPSTRFKRLLRHPQLSGVFLWSLAHLLVNGDSRSLLLFATLGGWSIVSMWTINRRDGAWRKPPPPDGWGADIGIVVAGIALAALAAYFHAWLSGVALF